MLCYCVTVVTVVTETLENNKEEEIEEVGGHSNNGYNGNTVTQHELLDFIRDRQKEPMKGYDMVEFERKYGQDVMKKLLSSGDVFQKSPGFLWVLE